MSEHPGRGKTVLVVEDDPDISDTLRDVLEAEGCNVVTAANGREGLDRVAELGKPALILLDMMMPVMSGAEFLDQLRKSPGGKDVPVIVVSAWPTEAVRVSAKTQGFLRKPVALESLLAALSWCERRAPVEKQ